MKFHREFDSLIDTPSKIAVLRCLFRSPRKQWTGRELGRESGVSAAQAARDLLEFMSAGLVSREIAGRANLWRLNSDHILAALLGHLFAADWGGLPALKEDLRAALRGAPVIDARIFGSVARGEEQEDSDIDLFLHVRGPAERREVEALLEAVRGRIWNRYGNSLSALIYTDRELQNPPNPPLMEAIAREGIDLRT